ncbi:MAG: non-canonical purine NTP pyrophosphatase [Bdellovibrionales bacterium]|nr:non-canonical purine NTP pyrophosphatase [Bdellovibrionales bacterium]
MRSLRKLFIATSNPGKLREIIPFAQQLLGGDIPIEGIAPPLDEESGSTYLENAALKAHALDAALRSKGESNYAIIADDSGLAVDALGGRPGIHSARYAGDHVAPELHMQKLLRELQPVKELSARTARYHCGLVLLVRNDTLTELQAEGTCEGLISFGAEGASGFGYDPIFILPQYGRTVAELDEATKQAISHRKHAFDLLRTRWSQLSP